MTNTPITNEPYDKTEWCSFTGPHPNDGEVTYFDDEHEAYLFATIAPHRRLAKRVVHYPAWEILDDQSSLR
jgi:hypothetical protein